MTKAKDTSADVDNQQIMLLRKAPIAKHISILRALSNTVLSLSQRTIRQEYSGLDDIAIRAAIVAIYYDSKLAERFQQYLRINTSSQKGSVYNLSDYDLLKALIPVVETFERLN